MSSTMSSTMFSTASSSSSTSSPTAPSLTPLFPWTARSKCVHSPTSDVEAQRAAVAPAYRPNHPQAATSPSPKAKTPFDDDLKATITILILLWGGVFWGFCLWMAIMLLADGKQVAVWVHFALTAAPVVGMWVLPLVKYYRLPRTEKDRRRRIKDLKTLNQKIEFLNGDWVHKRLVGGSCEAERELVRHVHRHPNDEEWMKEVRHYEVLQWMHAREGWVFRPERQIFTAENRGHVGAAKTWAPVIGTQSLSPLSCDCPSPEEEERATQLAALQTLIEKMQKLNGTKLVQVKMGAGEQRVRETQVVSQLHAHPEDGEWMALVREYKALQAEGGWVFRPGRERAARRCHRGGDAAVAMPAVVRGHNAVR